MSKIQRKHINETIFLSQKSIKQSTHLQSAEIHTINKHM